MTGNSYEEPERSPSCMELFPAPESDAIIWHYTDFTNLVAIFEGQGIYFSRADLLDDKFEGSISRPHRDYVVSGERLNPEDYAQRLRAVRSASYVHCWHISAHESAAMWKLYSSSTTDAIALHTTTAKLRKALPEQVGLGKVRYISYEHDEIPFGDLRWPLMHKRKSFEHENELRALYFDRKRMGASNNPEHWKSEPTDLNDLIEAIYISPWAKRWLFDLVKKVVRRYQLSIPVKQSALQQEPIF
jgi:hypothetical protein